MKYLLLFTTIFFFSLISCNKKAIDPNAPVSDPKGVDPLTISRRITDGWNKTKGLGGGRNYSFKNHLYEFSIEKDNSIVDFLLESADINIGFTIYNELGQEIEEQQGDRIEKSQLKLNSGKYSILVYSLERNAVGNYILAITGIPRIQIRVKSNWLKTTDQSFGDLGGGGYLFKGNVPFSYNSPRNNYFTFEVTEDNANLDIELESNLADCWMKLYDENETFLKYLPTSRYGFILDKLNKGKYKIWLGTKEREAKTNYVLNIYGKVAGLTEIEFKPFKNTGTWSNLESLDTYLIVVENDNSFIDFNLVGNFDVDFVVTDSNNIAVSPDSPVGNVYNKNGFHFDVYNKGIYEIKVYPSKRTKDIFSGSKNYTLYVVGNVKSVVKK